MYTATLMLLGAGELGREFAIAAKRLGCRMIACDRYADAPAMQVSDASEVFPMLDGKALRKAVEKHKPDVIIPEIEAIDTGTLAELEKEGWRVAPSAKAVQLTMNRDGIRDFASRELGLVTSKYRFAESREEAIAAAREVGVPCVIKPVMSSSGKGQSIAKKEEDVGAAWDYAVANMRGDRPRVIVEEFIAFDSEITLLTVATRDGVLFCARLSRKLAARGNSPRSAAVRTPPGAEGRRGTRRARHLRRRVLRARRPSHLLGAVAAAARYGDGDAHFAIPQSVRVAPARNPRPADPRHRADWAVGVGGHPCDGGER
jgi:phosphoribosylglycinamide formyltransferase 2